MLTDLRRWLLVAALWPGSGLGAAASLERGAEVVVVYNRRQAPDSRLVAEHYAERRRVPGPQVIGLSLPVTETMTRAEFQAELQKPLLRELQARNLLAFRDEIVPATSEKPGEVLRKPVGGKIRYLILCYGVPLRILRDETLAEPGTEQLRPEMRRNEAAVDSELAVLPRSGYRFTLAGPVGNPLYGATNAGLLHPTNGLLLVARLDGPSATIARGLVDKALQAETNGLWGRAYFDVRGLTNGSYKRGDDWIRAAYQAARRQGIETVLDERPETFATAYPLAQVALYAGWYDQVVSGPFTRPAVEFMPGAIAYHLFSFSARTLRSGSSWAGTFLAKGVTATFGAVDEPYLEGTPDVGVFFSRLLNAGFTFGEAAYAATEFLSWQTTVVGDPLYRPFGWKPRELHEELERRHSPLLEWSHLRVVNLSLFTDLPVEDLIIYLEQQPLTRQSAVLEQKLGDLHVLLGQLALGVEEYQRALKLQPSPQQKVHLQLALAQMQLSLARENQALELYQQFLQENPDYPDRLGLCQRALLLANKLGRGSAAESLQREIDRLAPPPPAAAAP